VSDACDVNKTQYANVKKMQNNKKGRNEHAQQIM